MKIGIFQWMDYANLCHEASMAMRSVGLDCTSYISKRHEFGYENQSEVLDYRNMYKKMIESDIIIIGHSDSKMYQLVKNIKGKRLFVWHTGTRYRMRHESHNTSWNRICESCFIALPEFSQLGAKGQEYISVTVDVDKYAADFENKQILTFVHFPSNPEVKGTSVINEVMRDLKTEYPENFRYVNDNKIIPHIKNMFRIKNCDVYIEMCSATQKGREYGSFGTTAIEAAALGKIVITNNHYKEFYEKQYGNCPMIIANTQDELRESIINLFNTDLTELKKSHRKWVEDNHSYNATGNRFKKILGL
jgi:hypothetical protein